ncbi:MAG: hypothetical protein VX776_11020 [Planctomycetota bacterium]|nr:hypothetical protein [Planctomycetota bacterium]MEC9097157.1 hypothetical protein [Planctomycetota bacterium]
MNKQNRDFTAQRKGVVLVMVVVVIAIMSLSAYGYTLMMQTESEATMLSGRRIQARRLVDSGVEHVRVFLSQGDEIIQQSGGIFDNPDYFQGVVVRNDEDPRMFGMFSILAPNMSEEGVQEGARFGLQDESVRLNLNILTLADAYIENGGRTLLLGLPEMDEEIADAIMDWIDEDDEAREFGCEFNDYYKGLNPTYTPKNGPLDSVEELLLVRGITAELLFGADANHNGVIDIEEQQAAGVLEPELVLGWSNYLTLFSKERNYTSNGQQRVNINSANLENLYNDLSASMREEWASYIVAYRLFGPYTPSDDDETDGVVTGNDLDLSAEGSFTFLQVLDLVDTYVKVDLGGDSVIVPSPITSDKLGGTLPTLMDNLSIYDQDVITGRLNINQCSRQLLLGIPGMTEEIADEIVSRRDLVIDPEEIADINRNWETWILAEGIVTLEEMRSMMQFITAKGHVHRAEIAGFFVDGKISSRASVVFDTTDRFPRILFWRDKSHLSLGYTKELLGAPLEE